ncbi:hypothetical protein Tco_1404727 [Tanacetum coccineum]
MLAEEALNFLFAYLKVDSRDRFNRLCRNDDGLPEKNRINPENPPDIRGNEFSSLSLITRSTRRNPGAQIIGIPLRLSVSLEFHKNNQYILATTRTQVFYLEDLARQPRGWKVVQHVYHRDVAESDQDLSRMDASPVLMMTICNANEGNAEDDSKDQGLIQFTKLWFAEEEGIICPPKKCGGDRTEDEWNNLACKIRLEPASSRTKTDKNILDESTFRYPTAQNMSGKMAKLPGGGSTSRRRGPQAFPDVISREEMDRILRQRDQEAELLRKQTAEAQQRALFGTFEG